MPSAIALLTDFGLDDPYVGQLKSVLAAQASGAPLIDVSHGVRPFDVTQAALFARASAPYLPARTVLLAVVDPGVGSARRMLLAAWRERLLLAPDNGLLGLFGADELRLWDVTPAERPTTATFHGRDLFAPLAARLALGARPEDVGQSLPVTDMLRPPWSVPRQEGDILHAHVLHVDRFGNALTNLHVDDWRARLTPGVLLRMSGAERVVRVVTHYAELAPGEPGLLAGSQGVFEVCLNQASAAAALSFASGAAVELRMLGEEI